MINCEKEVNNIVEFIRNYYEKNNLKGAVIGISGGKDSGVAAALLVRALGKENVIGVTLPCHSKEEDRKDAITVANKYGIKLLNVDLTDVYDSFIDQINKIGNFTDEELKNSNINIKPRLRMATEYYIAALYSAIKGGTYLVAGTSNKCELYVGYFTKGGDSTYDIGLLNNYTVEEVIKLGEYLQVPDEVIHKAPSDGLSGQTDEDKLGVKYADIARVIAGEHPESEEKILKLHNSCNHKFEMPVYERK